MNIKSVDCFTLKSWLENDEAILIDVREISENEESRINESILIPLGLVEEKKLPELNGKKLVIQCKSGGRSAVACGKLLEQNPALDIYNLEGGITAWKNCGFETLSGNSTNQNFCQTKK